MVTASTVGANVVACATGNSDYESEAEECSSPPVNHWKWSPSLSLSLHGVILMRAIVLHYMSNSAIYIDNILCRLSLTQC